MLRILISDTWFSRLVLSLCFIGLGLISACPLQADEYKVYILAGQSNGDGRAEKVDMPAALQATQTDVRIYYDDKYDGIVNNPYWQDLRPGLARGYGAPAGPVGYDGTDLFGPEITFGRAMADAMPDENIAIIKYTYGGTDLYTRWRPTDPLGDLYQNLLYHVENALDDLENAGHTYSLEGMLWMQGETDSRTSYKAYSYEDNLTDFVNGVRSNINGAENLKFVIGQISATGAGAVYLDVVQQAQYNVSQNMDNAALVVTKDLPLKSDDIHLGPASQRGLGERFANRFLVDATSNNTTIGYWRLEKSLGFVSDSSGNCLTLTRGNHDDNTSDEPSVYSFPASGNGSSFGHYVPQTRDTNAEAALFDGGNYFMHADDDLLTTSDFTIEAYFNRSSSGDNPVLASQYEVSGNQRGWVFGIRPTSSGSQLYLCLSEDGVGYEFNVSALAAPLLNNDYYAAVSFDESDQNSGITFYLKDLTAGTDMQIAVQGHTINSLHDSTADFTIGARSDLNCKFSGLIDEIRLSNDVLSEDDLLVHYRYAPGDANRDGVVDAADAALLSLNWGVSSGNLGWQDGDFNADGIVNAADASILAANWTVTSQESAPVPEPGTWACLITLMLGYMTYHRFARK